MFVPVFAKQIFPGNILLVTPHLRESLHLILLFSFNVEFPNEVPKSLYSVSLLLCVSPAFIRVYLHALKNILWFQPSKIQKWKFPVGAPWQPQL